MPENTGPHDSLATPESLLEHSAWLRRLVHALVSDAAQAEDVIQETWLASLKNPPRRAGRAWLRSVARNVARAFHRSASRRERRERIAAQPERLADPARMAERAELQRFVLEQVHGLHEPYKATLLQRYYDDLSPAEIGRNSGTPAGTVRARISRGLDLLRARLDRRCAGQRRAWVALLASPAIGRAAMAAGGAFLSARTKVVVTAVLVLAALSVLWYADANRDVSRDATRRTVDDRGTSTARQDSGQPLDTTAEEAAHTGEIESGDPAGAGQAWILSGTVRDRAGDPVPGARVVVGVSFGAVSKRLNETRADGRGHYLADIGRLRQLPPLQRSVARVSVTATAKGHKPGWAATRPGDVPHGEQGKLALRRDVVLERGHAMKGRVLRPDGRPAADAEVEVEGPGGDVAGGRAAPDGTFEIAIHRSGSHRIRAWQWGVGVSSTRLQLDAAQPASVPNLVLRGAGRIGGVVVDPAGLPCRDVEVRAQFQGDDGELPADGLESATARTDCDGHFVLAGLGTGRYLLAPDAAGGATYPTGASNVRLVLDGVRLRVSVRTEDGDPLLGVWVHTRTWGSREAPAVEEYLAGRTKTPPQAYRRASGFPLSIFRPEEPTVVRVAAPGSLWLFSCGFLRGSLPFQRVVKVPDAGVREMDIEITMMRMREPGHLQLVLRDTRGRPVAGYSAWVKLPVQDVLVRSFEVREAKDGRSPPLPPGRYVVHVNPGPALASFYFGFETEVEIRADETTRLKREVRTGGRLRARLEFPDRKQGENVSGVYFEVRAAGGRIVPGNTFLSAKDDTYVRSYGLLRNGQTVVLQSLLEPGAHQVVFTASGYKPAHQPVAVKAGEFAEAVFRLMRK